MRVTKPINLPQLQRELASAGVPYLVLGTRGAVAGGDLDLYDHGQDGRPKELPPEATPIINAHVAPPQAPEYASRLEVSAMLRTTDAQAAVIFRLSTAQGHFYRTTFRLVGIDAVSGVCKDTEVRVLFKRPAGVVAQVGAPSVLWQAQDASASSWTIQPSIDGTDCILSVKGAQGRTIDWLLTGEVGEYAPAGLPAPAALPPLPTPTAS